MSKRKKGRLNGEGTIYDKEVKKKRKNGEEYVLKYVEAQIMIDGQRLSKTFKSKGEASAWLLQKRDEVRKGIHVETDKITFAEFSDIWLKDKQREGKKPTTISGWKMYLDKHINPSIGETALQKITTVQLNKFYDDKLGINSNKKHSSKDQEKHEEPISPNTVIHFHRIIHNILNHAVKQRMLSYNPASVCSKPKAVKPEINILTVEEVLKLLDIASKHNIKKNGEINKSINPSYYPALVVAVYGGLRRSELFGLKWKYVDFENSTITIAETLLKDSNNKIYQDDDTKSYAGKRTISLPVEVMELLKHHKEFIGETDYVFSNRNGERPDPHNFNRFFDKLLEKAGITKSVRVHDLRHTNVSLLVKQNVNPKDISKRIGHSSYSFTMQTYAHIFPQTDKETAEKLSNLLQKPTTETLEKPRIVKGRRVKKVSAMFLQQDGKD